MLAFLEDWLDCNIWGLGKETCL